jgi:hypothetical protein
MVACTALVLLPRQAHEWAETVTWPKAAALSLVFGWSVAAMFTQSFSPFLYFQF